MNYRTLFAALIARFGGRLQRLDALLRLAASQQSPAGEPSND
ncbi:MAG: hypothetical protein ACE10O_07260 [Candidatus Acidiferrales bacterium]